MAQRIFALFVLLIVCLACSRDKKSVPLTERVERLATRDPQKPEVPPHGFPVDSVNMLTKPRGVLLTTDPALRLNPVYRVRYRGRKKQPFVGSNRYHRGYSRYAERKGNNWNNHFMPGFSALYGDGMVNVVLYDHEREQEKQFFDRPVVVNTVYYPAFDQDTLNGRPLQRDYYMVSAYDADTDGDGYISRWDLRRLYLFDRNGERIAQLVPPEFAVLSSQYDPANDYMYVFARRDENENGRSEYEESSHVFWIDLVRPERRGRLY